MKTKVNYLRKYNDTNTYSQTINVICSEKEFISMKEVVSNISIVGTHIRVVLNLLQ